MPPKHLMRLAGASNNFDGLVTLVGSNNNIGLRSDFPLWNVISGTGGLVLGNTRISGSTGHTLWLDGANTYLGPTIVSSGTVTVGAKSSLGSSAWIQVNSGATLNVSASPTTALAVSLPLPWAARW